MSHLPPPLLSLTSSTNRDFAAEGEGVLGRSVPAPSYRLRQHELAPKVTPSYRLRLHWHIVNSTISQPHTAHRCTASVISPPLACRCSDSTRCNTSLLVRCNTSSLVSPLSYRLQKHVSVPPPTAWHLIEYVILPPIACHHAASTVAACDGSSSQSLRQNTVVPPS
jgi:hypothetical protein